MPFSAKKGPAWLYAALATALTTGFWSWENYETRNKPSHDVLMQVLTVILFVAWVLMMAVIVVGHVSKLRIVPEGIAITLFGKEIRRVPAEQIRLLAGFRENTRKAAPMYLAVCSKTLEEFQEWGQCCQYDEPWEGERVIKYISRIPSVLLTFHLHKEILLLDWSPERLSILRQMYPEAQWLDCTQKKVFDAQLKQ